MALPAATRPPTVIAVILSAMAVGCGHDRLSFAVPDGGAAGWSDATELGAEQGAGTGATEGDGARSGAGGLSASEGGVSAAPAGGAAQEASDGAQQAGSAGAEPYAAGDEGLAGSLAAAFAGPGPTAPFDVDPLGHPTGPQEWAPGCARGQPLQELCGTGLDEDCDGTVDELAGIGAPCTPSVRPGCSRQAFTVCEPGTTRLICVTYGCESETYEPGLCGNGFVDPSEACDPSAPGSAVPEPLAPLDALERGCTAACGRPLFPQCMFSGLPAPCPLESRCSTWVGACMPRVTFGLSSGLAGDPAPAPGTQTRCPEVPVVAPEVIRPGELAGEDDGEPRIYPMVETEGGECWISCSDRGQCPPSLAHCYMGFCVVDFGG